MSIYIYICVCVYIYICVYVFMYEMYVKISIRDHYYSVCMKKSVCRCCMHVCMHIFCLSCNVLCCTNRIREAREEDRRCQVRRRRRSAPCPCRPPPHRSVTLLPLYTFRIHPCVQYEYTYILHIHTYILYIHTYMHTYIHTQYIYTYSTYMHTYIHTCIHSTYSRYIYTYIQI